MPGAISLAVVLVVWWLVVQLGLVPAVALPDPVAVAGRVIDWGGSGLGWRYLAPTLLAALLGSAVAAAVAVPLGIVIAHSRLLAAVVEPGVAFSQTVPLVALAPLLALWLGYGTLPIAVLAAVIAFFPMVTTTIVGLRAIDTAYIEQALLDGASGWQRLRHIELPGAGLAILAGIRAGVVLSMTGAIVGEFVMGGAGLGTLLAISREAADTVGVFAVLVWISATALALHSGLRAAETAAATRLENR
ncbi:MAG: ABC transporter permease [Arachnia propionica]|nr:MAG: ABC transporter permease [Arachnia propionica]